MRLVRDPYVVHDPWMNTFVVTLALAAAASRTALKVDAARRLPPAKPLAVGATERIVPLRVPETLDQLGVATLCASGILVFAFVALGVLAL